jgi:hypothetical protein
MDTLAPHDCPCWRLVEPLVDEPLPDHVCLETMIGTITSAERDGILPPPEDDRWPIPVGQRYLGMVLRQWAQEAPNQTLANQLEKLPKWRAEVRSLAYLWECGVLPDDAAHDRFIARRLQRRGLPATPATVRYVRALLAGEREPLPARGLLVTTRIYLRLLRLPNWPASKRWPEPPNDVAITGQLDIVTGPVLDRARDVALNHRNWLETWREHRLADVHEIRRAQIGAFKARLPPTAEKYDYKLEALRNLDALVLLAQHDRYGSKGAIRKYLDDVYYRVRKRRMAEGLPIAPPPNWRKEVRTVLEEELRARR